MKLRIFSKNKVVHENIYDHQMVECPICNREIKQTNTRITYEMT